MKKTKQLLACLVLMTLGLGTAHADYTLNLMRGVTQVSNEIYDLHMLVLWICVFIGIAVFGTMFYSIFHHLMIFLPNLQADYNSKLVIIHLN